MFWCTARAHIFRDRVISERIWVWLGDPVSAFPHSRLRWARALALQPDPRHLSSPGGARNAWAERASRLSPGVFSHVMIYFQGASSGRRRPDLELGVTDSPSSRFSLCRCPGRSVNPSAPCPGLLKAESSFPGQERFYIIRANRA